MKNQKQLTHDAADSHGKSGDHKAQGKEHKQQLFQKAKKWLSDGEAMLKEALAADAITQEEHDDLMQQNTETAAMIDSKLTALA